MIFYAPDLDNYLNMRDFYFGYEGFVPGPIARTEYELHALLEDMDKIEENYRDQIKIFARKFIQPFDGNACERVTRFLGLTPETFQPAKSRA
jgi:CDP-glycerol glycerophosphotransferase (TagB/SpsB family)